MCSHIHCILPEIQNVVEKSELERFSVSNSHLKSHWLTESFYMWLLSKRQSPKYYSQLR